MLKAVTVKEAQINRLKVEIGTADAIMTGAGAGLYRCLIYLYRKLVSSILFGF